MADYTSEEITTAVEKVVQSVIRKPIGRLGNREVQVTFDDLQNAAASVFILEPSSPFYVVFLGTERLAQTLVTEEEIVTELVEAIENTNRHVTEIDELSPLSNARSALVALEAASNSRVGSFVSIEDVPAFKRYDANLQRFLDESSKNSRSGGAIVPTPEESRVVLAGLISDLKNAHAETIARAGFLAVAIADYDELNLPAALARSVIVKAREILTERIEELEVLTPKERLTKIRDLTLDLLTGRAAVRGLGSLSTTTTFALIEGLGSVFADADHLATPAALQAQDGPYPIFVDNNELDFTMDSAFTFAVQVPGSFVAFHDFLIPEPYAVVAATNDQLLIDVDGFLQLVVPLSAGGTQSAQDIVDDINTAIGAETIVAERIFKVINFVGPVGDTFTDGLVPNGGDVDFVLTDGVGGPGADWASLGVIVGTEIQVTDSTSAIDGEQYTVSVLAANVMTGTGGAGLGAAETLKDINVGSSPAVRVRISDGAEKPSLLNRTGFTYPIDVGNTALSLFGITGNTIIKSVATGADQVAADVPLFFSSQSLGIPRLGASVVLASIHVGGLGRTDPDDPSKIIAYKFRGTGATVGGGPGTVVFTGLTVINVLVGDILVVRETDILGDTNAQGTVTLVTSTTIEATMSAAIGASDVLVEVGEDFSPKIYLDFRVTGSESHDGDYSMQVDGQEPIPFEFVLEQAFPLARDAGGQPFFFTLAVGNKAVVFESTVQDLTTKVEVFDSGSGRSSAPDFFPSLPVTDVGETVYFQLPELPNSVNSEDILELYETIFNDPTRTFVVAEVERSLKILELTTSIETDLTPLQVSQESVIPFARVRLGKKNNYTILQDAILAWLELSPNQPAYFVELGRLINPLVVGGNPTTSQVNTARSKALELAGILTVTGAASAGSDPLATLEAILAGYTVTPVDSVNTLVDTYLARGSDRGVDLLLQGRFSTFFGLSLEGLSTGGHFREMIREVTRLDFPVRRTGRQERLDIEMIEGEFEDQDFEFVFTDTDDPREDVDIPGDFDEILPPGF